MLFFVAALSLVALAALGTAQATSRRHVVALRERAVRRVAAVALAIAESRARAELLDHHSGTATPAPPAEPDFEGFAVDVARDPVHDLRLRWVVERDADSGAIHQRQSPVVELAAASIDAVAAALEPYAESAAGRSTMQSLAVSLFEARGMLADADDLRAFVDHFVSQPGRSVGVRVDELLAGVDPLARLRRTNAHPTRTDGYDRGRLTRRGPPIEAGPTLVQRFTATLRQGGAEPRTWSVDRQKQVLHRIALRAQQDWLEPQLDQPGGILVGAALGPEVISDQDWDPGATEFVPTSNLAPLEVACQPRPHGLLLAGAGVRARIDDVGGLLRFVTLPPAPFAEESDDRPIQWVPELLLVGDAERSRVGFAHESVWCGWGRPQRLTRCPARVRALCPIGGRMLVWLIDDTLLLVESDGRVTREVFDFVADGAPVWLPLLDRWAFPVRTRGGGWRLVDVDLEVSFVGGSVPGADATLVQSDGVDGVFWVAPAGTSEVAVVCHTWIATDGARTQVGPALAGPAVAMSVFPARGVVATWRSDGRYELWRSSAVALARAGDGQVPEFHGVALPDVSRMSFWIPTPSGIVRHTLRPRSLKRVEFGAQMVLPPAVHPGDATFHAPLVRGLEGELLCSDGSRVVIEPTGTLTHAASVLRAPDLSDLFVDGAYSSPLRGETLRYSTVGHEIGEAELAIEEGSAELLVKPERRAATSADPGRPRTLLRLVQRGSISFAPDGAWIAQFHPSQPTASQIRAYQVIGPTERELRATSSIVRTPAAGSWEHQRSVTILGSPWELRVWVGEPPAELPRVVVDQAYPDGVLGSTIAVADTMEGGEWSRVGWGWSAGGRASLRIGAGESEWAADVTAAPWGGSAFRLRSRDWTAELGGEVGGAKSFKGTVQGLSLRPARIDPLPAASPIFASASRERPAWRWVLPFTVAPGGALVRVAALGEFPAGTELEWRIDAWSAGRVESSRSRGRSAALPPRPQRASRYVVTAWLHADASGRRTPLVEAVEVSWLAAPEPWTPEPLPLFDDPG
ncbi:MAG: hypothetical protein AB7O52_06045 [Planctomycetota bacterium]